MLLLYEKSRIFGRYQPIKIMFYFRLDRLFVKDNRRRTIFKSRDKADLQIYSFVTTSDNPLPALKALTRARSERSIQRIIRAATREVIASRVFTPVKNIKDNHELTFGDTGIVLYRADTIPPDFNWQLVVIGSRRKTRDDAKMFKAVVEDEEFISFSSSLMRALEGAQDPKTLAAVEIGKYVARFLLHFHSTKEDDQLGLIYQSWNRQEHYEHGKRFKDNVPDLTKNMFYDYSMFGFDE